MQRSSQAHRPLLPSALQHAQFRQLAPCMCPQQQQNGQRAVQAAAYQFKQGPDVPERAIAALPYLLPLLDALPYGGFHRLWCMYTSLFFCGPLHLQTGSSLRCVVLCGAMMALHP